MEGFMSSRKGRTPESYQRGNRTFPLPSFSYISIANIEIGLRVLLCSNWPGNAGILGGERLQKDVKI